MTNTFWTKISPIIRIALGCGLLLGAPIQAFNKPPLRVAIIDTGLSNVNSAHMCPDGHKDFTNSGSIKDTNKFKHGSNIAAIIDREAGPGNWCFVVLKVFNNSNYSQVQYYLDALKFAATQNYAIVNLSITGPTKLADEETALNQLLNAGVVVNVAAGNDSQQLRRPCNVYPACGDPRLNVVSDAGLVRANKGGPVDVYINGRNVEGGGVSLSGTSQSTAIFTGRVIREALLKY